MPTQTPLNKESTAISAMFNKIAGNYDSLNHLFSFGIDKYWRKKAVNYTKRISKKDNIKALDIACGTGDSTIELFKQGFSVTGIDIAKEMIAIAKQKAHLYPLIKIEEGNAQKMKYADNSFDAVTIFFGIRNFNYRDECLKEIYRITKKDGTLTILEFTKPRYTIIKCIYNFYLNSIIPLIGGLFAKDKKAYRYLSASIEAFPKYEAFCNEISDAGYKEVNFIPYTFGICTMYIGKKF